MTQSNELEMPEPLRAGDVIGGRYRVLEPIGRGATGVVYRGNMLSGGGGVALKVIGRELCGDKQIFGRYRREAKILEHLSGDHLVKLLDFVEHDGLLVIALELVDGTPLDQVLSQPIELDDGIDIALQVAEGLNAAHRSGVVHRDLKPANVMIEPRGWPRDRAAHGRHPHVRILDFGLAKVVHGEHMTTGLTEHDMIFGTPEYMSPEQARGDALDGRSDVYAAGIMLYEMATGQVPFARKTPLATMTAQLTEDVVPPRQAAPARQIPAALEAVILRALAKDPKDRYATAAAFAEALRAVRERRVTSVHPPPGEGDALGLGETDLAIRLSQVSPERKPAVEARSTAGATSPPPPLAPGEERGRAMWIAIAVIVVVLAVLAGVALAR